jgi:hypothetical protein
MTERQTALSMAYKNWFNSEHGKKVLDDLDRKCKYARTGIYVSDSSRQTDFNLGMHEVILYIHQEIERNLTEPEGGKAIHKEIQWLTK